METCPSSTLFVASLDHLIATFTKRDIVDKLPCCLHRAKDTYASVLFEAIFVDQVVTAKEIRWGGHSRDQA